MGDPASAIPTGSSSVDSTSSGCPGRRPQQRQQQLPPPGSSPRTHLSQHQHLQQSPQPPQRQEPWLLKPLSPGRGPAKTPSTTRLGTDVESLQFSMELNRSRLQQLEETVCELRASRCQDGGSGGSGTGSVELEEWFGMDAVQEHITRLVRSEMQQEFHKLHRELQMEGMQGQLRVQVFAEVNKLRDNLELLATKAEVSTMQLSSCTEEVGQKVCEMEEKMQSYSAELSSVQNRLEVNFRECQESLSRATSLRTIFAEKQERKHALTELSEVMPRLKALEDAISQEGNGSRYSCQDTSMTMQDELSEAVPEPQQPTTRSEYSSRFSQSPEVRSAPNSRCSSAATFGGAGVGSCLVAVTSDEPQVAPMQGDDCGPEQLQRRLEDTDRAVTGALRLQGRFAERFANLLTAHDARLADISERVQLIHETTSPKGASCGDMVGLPIASRLESAELASKSCTEDLGDLQNRMLAVERQKLSINLQADFEKLVPRIANMEENIAEAQAQCAKTEMRTTSMEMHFATCMGHSKEMVTECGNQVVAQRGEMERLETRLSTLEGLSQSNDAEEVVGKGIEASKGEWDKIVSRITDLEDLMQLLRKDDQAQMKAMQTDLQKLTPRVEDLEAMQQADWERLAPRITGLESSQLDSQKLGARITKLEAVLARPSNEEVPSSEHSRSCQAESPINQFVPRIATLEESLGQFKSRVEDLEVALSGYLEVASSTGKVGLSVHVEDANNLDKAVSTGLLESERPSANGEAMHEATAHISVQSISTLPEEDREPMPAGSFVLDGRIVAPPAIRAEAMAVDSCLTEAVYGGSPGAFGGSGSVLEASLPSCTTEMPDVGNSLPSTPGVMPGATIGPLQMMPGNGRGTATCASTSLSPSGSQSPLVDPDSTRPPVAARQSRPGTAVLTPTRVAGQSPVLGMQSQFPPQMQQQQHGSQPNGRQASQRRWTAPAQGVPPPPDAWSPQEPQSATTAERRPGSVILPEGISPLPLTLLQAELLGQVPPGSRRSLPAGMQSTSPSAVMYQPTSVNPPSVQPPTVRQATPNQKQQQQQQQTSHTPGRQRTPLRATTPSRLQQQQACQTPGRQQTPLRSTTPSRQRHQQQHPPSQPQTPRMAPFHIPPPPIPATRGSLGSQHRLKQPPAHKQQQNSQHHRGADGTPPQRARTRLCEGYSTSPRRCIHSWVGPVGAWQRGTGGVGGASQERGVATPNKSLSSPASAPTSPLLTARR